MNFPNPPANSLLLDQLALRVMSFSHKLEPGSDGPPTSLRAITYRGG